MSNSGQSYILKQVPRFFVLLSIFFAFSGPLPAYSVIIHPKTGVVNVITEGLFYQKTNKQERQFPEPSAMSPFLGAGAMNLGFSHDDYWFFFKLETLSSEGDWMLEFPYPFHDLLEVWVIGNRTDTQYYSFSDQKAFKEREILHRHFLIPLRLKPRETVSVYARLRCEGEASSFPVQLMEKDVFRDQDYRRQMTSGLYYGILLFALILSLFLVVKIGEVAQYYYLFYLIGLALFQFSLDGFAFQYLWPGAPWVANHIIPVSGSLSLMFLIQFSRVFLKIEPGNKTLWYCMQGASLCLLLLAVFGLFGNPFFSLSLLGSNVLALPVLLILLLSALSGLKSQMPSARYFILAFALLIAGSSLALLKNLGFLPRIFITEYGIQIGSAVEIMMLSFGLTENLKHLKTEHEKVQERLLKELQDKYLLQQRAKKELEEKVEERTRELKEKNAEIASKNKDITDSIFYARRIQQATLPHDEELQDLLPGCFVWYKPRDIVSGDFYWAGRRGDLVFIAVADCTGHGVPGSMMSMAAHSFFNEIIHVHGTESPAEILEALRDKIIQLLRQEKNQSRDGMDISLLVLDRKKQEIRFSGAFNPAYVLKSGQDSPHERAQFLRGSKDQSLWSLPADRFPVGMLRDEQRDAFTEMSLSMKVGDMYFLFTDGYADQFGGEKGKKLKNQALQDIFLHTSYPEMPEKLENVFKEWKGMNEQVDDVCILGFRISEEWD